MVQQILKTKKGKWAIALTVLSVVGTIALLSDGQTSSLSGTVILLAISGLLISSAVKDIKKTQPDQNNVDSPAPAQHIIESNGINLTVSAKTTTRYVTKLLADGEIISKLDLGWGANPSGGFGNWSVYEITGINQATGRKDIRKYDARDERGAIAEAKKGCLIEPYSVRLLPHDAPTEKQINYLLSWNASLPDGASKYDVSAMLSRLEDSYDTVYEKQTPDGNEYNYIRPLPSPSVDFARYADDMGLYFSSFVGAETLFNGVVRSLEMRDKIAFFAYCVLCSYHRWDIGNLLSSPYKDRLYEFADIVIQDDALVKSVAQRTPYDYKNIHKGTKIYKAVAEYFGIK